MKTSIATVSISGNLREKLDAMDAALRITLNGAETHRTLAGSFLAESFSGAVQHVAFASDDIFSTAQAMAGLGFQALPMPVN